jgi:hypothetical protein
MNWTSVLPPGVSMVTIFKNVSQVATAHKAKLVSKIELKGY